MKNHPYQLSFIVAGLMLTGGAYALPYIMHTVCLRNISSFYGAQLIPASSSTALLRQFENPNYLRLLKPIIKVQGQPMDVNCVKGFTFLNPNPIKPTQYVFNPATEIGSLQLNGIQAAKCPAVSITSQFATINITAVGTTIAKSQCLVEVVNSAI